MRKADHRTCRYAEEPRDPKSCKLYILHVGSRGVTNLVTRGVTKTGEQRGELAGDRSVGVLLEDDLLESGSIGNL